MTGCIENTEFEDEEVEVMEKKEEEKKEQEKKEQEKKEQEKKEQKKKEQEKKEQEKKEQEKKEQEKKEQEKKEQEKDKFMKKIFYNSHSPKLYDEFTDELLDYAKKLPKNWIALDEVGGDLKFKKASFDEDTIVSYTAYKSNGVTSIQIYLDRLDFELNEREILELAHHYLDKPTLMEQMSLTDSYTLVKEGNNAHNVMVYSPIENIQGYPKRMIHIMLEEEKGKIIELHVSDSKPRWMSSAKRNGFEHVDWTSNI